MQIKQAEFIGSAVNATQYPKEHQPEFALAGRSNVGKSSLINRFLNRKNLARTSSQPGKTQTLNFYHINQEWYFVDLPGYGYARSSKEDRARWGRFIEQYLSNRQELAGVIQVIDLRHPPMDSDVTMMEWLRHYGLPMAVVGTKADKLSRGSWQKQSRQIREGLSLTPDIPLIVYSSETGQGRDELALWLQSRLDEYRAQQAVVFGSEGHEVPE
jgi:GTP-binding protein